jgi:hypothetical protein
MNNNMQKTIPYRLSIYELENLRLLRNRTQPSRFIRDDEEKMLEEMEARNSGRDRLSQEVEKKIP